MIYCCKEPCITHSDLMVKPEPKFVVYVGETAQYNSGIRYYLQRVIIYKKNYEVHKLFTMCSTSSLSKLSIVFYQL